MMKHYTSPPPPKRNACALLALFLWALPSLASAQSLVISPQPTEGFVITTVMGINFPGYCGVRNGVTDSNCNPSDSMAVDFTLAVTTNAPYQFVGWSGDCSGTSASVTVMLNAGVNKTCSPHFIRAAYTQVAGFNNHQCAVTTNGGVQCWGLGSFGRLGNGKNNASLTPVTVQGISTAMAVSVGNDHSCALLMDKTVQCWGSNSNGELGIGTKGGSFNTPQAVIALSNVMAIDAGSAYTCAIREGGQVLCWGSGSAGNLGLGATGQISVPTTLSNIANAVVISAASSHTCTVLSTGGAKCWGFDQHGALGTGSVSAVTPEDVLNLSEAIAISAGLNHTCALLNNGGVQCWGLNSSGQLGTGNNNNSNTPVDVKNLSTAIAISAGNAHTCALLNNGRVQCWGSNSFGQLGLEFSVSSSTVPVIVPSITTAIAVEAETEAPATCALLTDGNAYCWGTRYSNVPTPVPGQPGVLTPSAATTAFHGYAFTAASPYRTIANTLSGTLPSWLQYSPSIGVFFGTPTAGSGSAPNLKVTVSDSALIPFPAIDIPIISQAVPTALTVSRASTRPLNIPTDVPVGVPLLAPRFIAKDQNNAEVPVQWSLLTTGPSLQFAIDPDAGTISLLKVLVVGGYGDTVEARFPSPSQLVIQPSLSSLTSLTGSLPVTFEGVAPSPINLHIKLFLEGPLQ